MSKTKAKTKTQWNHDTALGHSVLDVIFGTRDIDCTGPAEHQPALCNKIHLLSNGELSKMIDEQLNIVPLNWLNQIGVDLDYTKDINSYCSGLVIDIQAHATAPEMCSKTPTAS